jgi:hypothetical protein
MRWRQRRKLESDFEAPDLVALARRATTLDSSVLYDALETTLSNAGNYFRSYRQTHEPDYLAELGLAGQAIFVMANELSLRAGGPLVIEQQVKKQQQQAARQVREPKPSRPY